MREPMRLVAGPLLLLLLLLLPLESSEDVGVVTVEETLEIAARRGSVVAKILNVIGIVMWVVD